MFWNNSKLKSLNKNKNCSSIFMNAISKLSAKYIEEELCNIYFSFFLKTLRPVVLNRGTVEPLGAVKSSGVPPMHELDVDSLVRCS